MERNEENTQKLIKLLIKNKGSRTAAALAIGCTESYVYSMESGKNVPGRHLFDKLVEIAKK